MATLTSNELRFFAETDFKLIKIVSNTIKSLVQLSNLNEEHWKELFSKIADFKENRIRNINYSGIYRTKSYFEKFVELGGIETIIEIIKNWFNLNSTLISEYDSLKFITFNKLTNNEIITIGGNVFNIPILQFYRTIGGEIQVNGSFSLRRLKDCDTSFSQGRIVLFNQNYFDYLGELISKYIDLTDSNPILQHILKPINLKIILEFNKKNLSIINHTLVNCDIKFVLENLQYFTTLKNKILNTNELDEIEEIKEYKIKHQEAEIERELKQQKEQQELQLKNLENERKKYNDYFNSFIKPYEDKIKQLENQVTYLRKAIVLISRNNTNITPIEQPILNDISEDPI